ncbi:MAG: hypothetical protein FD123_1831 [Bacteroidetes bacterium]|nr:MAG: hypothetical protein FD123_1831 [Bacteroidota bacterium]
MNVPVLSSLYLAPLEYYAVLAAQDSVVIDLHEHFVKQTWRNRCRIAGPNGLQDLVIPVEKYANHTPAKDIRMSYHEQWQRLHWRSIKTAYGNSAFFEFYADYFSPFYEARKTELLSDFNREILELTLRLLKINCSISYSENFIETADADYREKISPKSHVLFSAVPRYAQVFEERHGFQQNLSVIDLLCCAGPESGRLLKG